VGTIQARGAGFISLTSIQPDNRVITIGAASEELRLTRELPWLLVCIEVGVEFVMVVAFL